MEDDIPPMKIRQMPQDVYVIGRHLEYGYRLWLPTDAEAGGAGPRGYSFCHSVRRRRHPGGIPGTRRSRVREITPNASSHMLLQYCDGRSVGYMLLPSDILSQARLSLSLAIS
jgi:hypothetical protein